jgi:hypothetical protein
MARQIDLEKVVREQEQLTAALGGAMLAWSKVEQSLALWFALISKMPHDMVLATFYSCNTASARIDLVKAALEHSSLNLECKKFFNAALSKSRAYSNFRNILAHGEMMLEVDRDSDLFGKSFVMQGRHRLEKKRPNNLFATFDQIKNAQQSFTELSVIIVDVWCHAADVDRMARNESPLSPFEPAKPKLALQQIRELPSHPHLHPADQN